MKKKILVAPLNWGIGHATRCIPIINWLLDCNFTPIIASDGDALLLLQKEFPNLESITLPAFNIQYQKKGKNLDLKLFTQLPHILKTLKAERQIIKRIINHHKIDGIISDCRFGIYSKSVPSVIITHQLNVLSGSTTYFSSKLNQLQLKKFKEIWVPDFKNEANLSGRLGHISKKTKLNIKYLGPLSRLNKTEAKTEYDLMVLLSGPEPQRSLLENKLIKELHYYKGSVLFVKGKIETEQTKNITKKFTVYNFMTSEALEKAINSSNIVICRSGYTTVMDLAKLGKHAFFIPTPGQFEQEYLAKRFNTLKLTPTCSQKDFNLNELKKVETFNGLNMEYSTPNLDVLFSLF
ncbi:glycosyltransferase [Lacinutrix sp. Bg11-31]|uniref:glycosyltransferase n=1 Tax=Lacinutrix sp. Bg11-31 TaxID=2057808 RepID=UPI000C31159A|nr:glycosyltransferase [Lacinutrix sp. Bg11-31]AUC82607.1 glycosyltransferase [Lacinutrix sp. Bg11-31]